uniref:Uncharacterized protein n=1 Tax=Fagus sylvatica TaxID=28930 RepID=A0A2N9GZS8_FAGSY
MVAMPLPCKPSPIKTTLSPQNRTLAILLSSTPNTKITAQPLLKDNGQMHEHHLLPLLSGIIEWIDPPDAVTKAIEDGKSESEMLDGCRALFSIANVTTPFVFDQLLKSIRPFGTLTLLSTLMCGVVKVLMSKYPEEETWSWEARDILLDTWTALLVPLDSTGGNALLPPEGINAAGSLFTLIVESELKVNVIFDIAAATSALTDDVDSDYLLSSISAMDERLSSYALIARAAIHVTIPFLTRLFSERFSRLNQGRGIIDPTETLEEIYSLLLIAGHVLADEGEGETPLVPYAVQTYFPDNIEADEHPVILLSRQFEIVVEEGSVFNVKIYERGKFHLCSVALEKRKRGGNITRDGTQRIHQIAMGEWHYMDISWHPRYHSKVWTLCDRKNRFGIHGWDCVGAEGEVGLRWATWVIVDGLSWWIISDFGSC